MTSLALEATVQRTALLLGLRSGHEVAAWCDGMLHELDAPPAALIDLAMVSPDDLSLLRSTLQPLCIDPEPAEVIAEMLRLAAADLASGRRTAAQTVRVLAQMRRMLPLGAQLADAFDGFEDAHMLAVAGVQGDVADVEARLTQYLSTCAFPTSISNPTPASA